jgi:hypothetical protein
MLQKAKMVKKARKALESMYEGTCDIVEHKKVKKSNGATVSEDVKLLEKEPCRLSFKTITSTNPTDTGASALKQTTTLFINPDVKIAPGSKIIVTQNNVTTEFKQSGEPAMYDTHQEIILDIFKGWS